MNRTTRPIGRLAALAITVLSLVLATAGQAAAIYPRPDPGGPSGYEAPSTTSVQPVTDNSVGSLQWLLFAVAVLGALAIGASLMNLLQRRRRRLA